MNKQQKELKQRYESQPTHCKCGLPIPPMNTTMCEGCLGAKQVYKKHEHICDKCKIKHIRVG